MLKWAFYSTEDYVIRDLKSYKIKERDEREELSAAIERESKQRKQQDEYLDFKMDWKNNSTQMDNRTEKWYTGKVIQAVGDI